MRKSKIDHRSSTEFSIGVPVKHEPVPGADGFHRLRVLRLAVFDVLRFVEHHGVEFQPAILLRVAPNQRVAGDDQIVRGNLREPPCRAGPCRASTRSSGVNFVASACQLKTRMSGRRSKRRPTCPACCRMRQHLQCFSQSHFVGQNAAETVLAQESQPGHALLLVRAQDRFQRAQRRASSLTSPRCWAARRASRRAPAPANPFVDARSLRGNPPARCACDNRRRAVAARHRPAPPAIPPPRRCPAAQICRSSAACGSARREAGAGFPPPKTVRRRSCHTTPEIKPLLAGRA